MITNYGFIAGKFNKLATVTIGNFDGVHLGHISLIEHTKNIAKQNNTPVGVITFDINPIERFNKNNQPFYLTSLQDKISYIINNCNVDFVYILKFNNVVDLTPENFVKSILIDQLNVSSVIIGENHSFGINKSGTSETLIELGDKFNFNVNIFNLKTFDHNLIISSGMIRKYINSGEIKKANELLGKKFCITGVVVRGSQIAGTKLNHKTANLFTEVRYIEPKFGVYAILIKLNGTTYKGIGNFGIRPTFNHTNPQLEVHILNENLPDFYGERISVEFVDYIREEKKFNSIDDLKNQINQDCEVALILF